MQVIIRRHKKGKICINYRNNIAIVDAPYSANIYTIQHQLCDSIAKNNTFSSSTRLGNSSALDTIASTDSSVDYNYSIRSTILPDRIVQSMVRAQCVLIGGQVYNVVPSNNSRAELIGGQLCIHDSKYYDSGVRGKTVRAFVRQYANAHLRASISRVGCQLSYCPSNIKLVSIKGDNWIGNGKISSANAIVMDYRVVQLPYTCQDRIILRGYSQLTDTPDIATDYIDDMIYEYTFVKQL